MHPADVKYSELFCFRNILKRVYLRFGLFSNEPIHLDQLGGILPAGRRSASDTPPASPAPPSRRSASQPSALHASAYSSEMMRCVRAVHSALARSMSMPGHTPSR